MRHSPFNLTTYCLVMEDNNTRSLFKAAVQCTGKSLPLNAYALSWRTSKIKKWHSIETKHCLNLLLVLKKIKCYIRTFYPNDEPKKKNTTLLQLKLQIPHPVQKLPICWFIYLLLKLGKIKKKVIESRKG